MRGEGQSDKGSELRSMENIVNLPRVGEFKTEENRTDPFDNLKGAMSSVIQLVRGRFSLDAPSIKGNQGARFKRGQVAMRFVIGSLHGRVGESESGRGFLGEICHLFDKGVCPWDTQ